ncbi:azurin [Neisseria sp. HSC-16F19]|nr:azurin [Neisseria sp. HSC-16F19]MCP2039903.1 azurin [Neisseria sp. HSC-16F19]
MKAYLSLITAAALGLAACSGQQSAPAAQEPAATASTPAAAETAPETASEAADNTAATPSCEAVIESNDQMRYDTDTLTISKQCDEFTLVLKHVGQMPKMAMGHNVVITRTADIAAVAKDGQSAGADKEFVKAGDERIVAHTGLIGGGEETRVTFSPSQFGDGDYSFFCSFPGHEGMMRGKVVLTD